MRWQEKYNAIYVNLFSSYYDLLPKDLKNKYIKKGFWKKLIRVTKVTLFDLKNVIRKRPSPSIPHGKKWIVVDAVNNLQSVNDIFTRKQTNVIYFTHSSRFSKTNRNVILFDFSKRFLYVWKMVLYVILNIGKVKNRWDLFLTETGWYELSKRFLRKHKPSAILFTNDHTPVNRGMMLAARALNIPTGYIQHACVREDFGELLVNDAFLDGQDSIDKYAAHGNRFSTQMHLIGMPKLSRYLYIRSKAKKIETLGIAYNITDDLSLVASLAKKLQQAGFKILVRPHPKDHRLFAPMVNVTMDDPVNNTAFDFLNRIDALIAGESAIHAESILLNKPSFQYNFNPASRIHDLYGFLKNDFVREYAEPEKLLDAIQEFNAAPVDVYKKGAYYSSMVDHPKEAEAAHLAFEKIDQILFNAR